MFIIARKSDEKIIKVSGTYANGQTPSKEIMIPKIVKEFGGVIDDYEYLFVEDKSIVAERIMEGDSFNLNWKEEPIDEKTEETTNKIDTVDFDIEDSKLYIDVNADKSIINTNDESDFALITFRLLKSDKSSVEKTTISLDIPIVTPNRVLTFIKLDFINGIVEIPFVPSIFGKWIFPASDKKFGDYRISNQVEIQARMPI